MNDVKYQETTGENTEGPTDAVRPEDQTGGKTTRTMIGMRKPIPMNRKQRRARGIAGDIMSRAEAEAHRKGMPKWDMERIRKARAKE